MLKPSPAYPRPSTRGASSRAGLEQPVRRDATSSRLLQKHAETRKHPPLMGQRRLAARKECFSSPTSSCCVSHLSHTVAKTAWNPACVPSGYSPSWPGFFTRRRQRSWPLLQPTCYSATESRMKTVHVVSGCIPRLTHAQCRPCMGNKAHLPRVVEARVVEAPVTKAPVERYKKGNMLAQCLYVFHPHHISLLRLGPTVAQEFRL